MREGILLHAPKNDVECISFKWHVPKGYPTGGFFRGHVEYYSKETQDTYEAQNTESFLVDEVTGTLKISIYNDLNNNGLHDFGEPPLQGWHFTATGPESLAGDTNTGGLLIFMNVFAGSYQVTETLKADWACSDPGPSLQKTVTVPPSGNGYVDFGNYDTKGTLIIFKYNDLNKNGQLDLGEPWLPSWPFIIIPPGNPIGISVVTDPDGKIIMRGDAGDWVIREIMLADWVCSDPGPNLQKTIATPAGTTVIVEFGNYLEKRFEGDVNNDGLINSGDALLIAKHVVGTTTLTGDNFLAADVNDDQVINGADLLLIKKYIVGTINQFPGGVYIP